LRLATRAAARLVATVARLIVIMAARQKSEASRTARMRPPMVASVFPFEHDVSPFSDARKTRVAPMQSYLFRIFPSQWCAVDLAKITRAVPTSSLDAPLAFSAQSQPRVSFPLLQAWGCG